VGTTSPAKNVTLKNAQAEALNVSSINVTGDFALAPSTTCPSSGAVSAGESCTVAVTFTPTATGTRTGRLVLQTDYPTAPVAVHLSGTGTP
jgi:Abnormal spindle-like microcephaly-assoc'd, ASPM-SPD-2-Hydin